LKFAGRRDVTALHAVERVMAVPMKRFERPLLGHLTRPEMIAVLGQPGTEWTSQRDHLLLSLLYNTGARVSGDRRGARRRRGAGRRGLRPSARQGPQGSLGAAVEVHRGGHPRLVARQPRPARFGGTAAQSIRPCHDAVQRSAATGARGQQGIG
jgi:hypothetical protein